MVHNANKVNILGRTLFYKTNSWDSEYGCIYRTDFWEDRRPKMVRTGFLGLFGKHVIIDEPIVLFAINRDTQDGNLSKEWWYNAIANEINAIDRKEQIAAGTFELI